MTNSPIDTDVFSELKEAAGDEFAAELVNTFLDEVPGMIDELRTAAKGADADGYRRAAHSLKSNAATFGATGLADLARRMELGELPGDGALAEIETLQAALDQAAIALKDLIDE